MKVLDDLRNDSPMATEIHKLGSRLWHNALKHNQRVLLFTSALRGEGKSTTVAYLATALAQHPGRRILAVDLDFRRPTLGNLFEVEIQPGLAEVLRGECGLPEVLTPTRLPGLQIIQPFGTPQGADPNLMHDSARLQEIFTALRPGYHMILLDSPALVPVADAAAMMPLADGVILVTMAGLTTKHHLTRARELCLGMGSTLLGLVVGNIQVAAPEYLDGNYYAYAKAKTNGGAEPDPRGDADE